ncbi:MAG: hypothetical protein JST54_23155 [Deltaproteobacteria bacterium]|nr:hypothetical protein [Deltaproteobacteria bacterium]
MALVLGFLSAAMTVPAALAVFNLVTHEGWSVVIGEDALELPGAPFRSRKRDRIAYTSIRFLAASPAPPQEPTLLLIHLSPPAPTRWVKQRDLRSGSLAMLARVLVARVSAASEAQAIGPRSIQ